VDVFYTEVAEQSYVDAALMTVLQIHAQEEAGDVLVFLTGEDEIESMRELISERCAVFVDNCTWQPTRVRVCVFGGGWGSHPDISKIQPPSPCLIWRSLLCAACAAAQYMSPSKESRGLPIVLRKESLSHSKAHGIDKSALVCRAKQVQGAAGVSKLEVVTLYARLTNDQQMNIFNVTPKGTRKASPLLQLCEAGCDRQLLLNSLKRLFYPISIDNTSRNLSCMIPPYPFKEMSRPRHSLGREQL